MSDMNVDQVLAQMRVMAAQAKQNNGLIKPAEDVKGLEFSQLLKTSIDAVNDVQKNSGELKKRFELGDESVSLVDVTIASEKAKIAFTAMTQVRNKLVEAYQEVMRMPV